MKFKKIAISLALVSTLATSSQVMAHGVWVAKVNGEQAIGYGHAGTDTDSYDSKKVTSVVGFKADGSKADVTITAHEKYAELKSDNAAILSIVFNNGFYAQNKDGKWINKRGDQVEGAESSNQYFKTSVSYQNPRVKPMATGLALEIVPAVNPSTLQQGEDLKVQVLYDGKPVADAKVKSNYFDSKAPSVKTDKDGYAVVRVATGSFNILEVGHAVKADNPFDGKKYSSTLTFKAKRLNKDH